MERTESSRASGALTNDAGPLYEQHFDLLTGNCLEDPATRVPVHAVRVHGGVVHVALTVATTEVDVAGGG